MLTAIVWASSCASTIEGRHRRKLFLGRRDCKVFFFFRGPTLLMVPGIFMCSLHVTRCWLYLYMLLFSVRPSVVAFGSCDFAFFFVCDCNLAVLDVVFSLWLMIIDGIENTSRLVVCFYLSVCIIRLRGRSGERFCIVKSLKTHWLFLSLKPSTPGNNFSYLSLSCFRFTPRTADFLIALRDWSTECWSWNCVNRTNRFEC